MSRIGKLPIKLPEGVGFNIVGSKVEVKGSKGTLSRVIHENINVTVDDKTVTVVRADDTKFNRSLHGLTRTLLNNMVVGVTEGFEKKLQIIGVGYRATLKGKDLVFSIGYSHPVEFKAAKGISFEVGDKGALTVKGIDKELVGQVSADIRAIRKPEPYKGKGIKYADEVIIRKAGKSGAK